MAYSVTSSVSSSMNSISTSSAKPRGRTRGKGRRKNLEHTTSTIGSKSVDTECDIIEQYKTWCSTLKIELKSKSQYNVDVRMEKIEKMVNNIIDTQLSSICHSKSSANSPRPKFYICNEDKLEIRRQIEDKIDLWKGVEIEVCKNKEKKSFEAYQATARNWFNRNKAKIYGNHLFYELIYHHILRYCAQIQHDEISEAQKMMLFIDIFERILSEPIQFPRTKLQPLLPHQSLMQPNKFKKACEQFTNIYNIRWMLNNSANNTKRDRDRAKKIHSSFMSCLGTIKQSLQSSENEECVAMIYPFEQYMNDDASNSNNSNHAKQTRSDSVSNSSTTISLDYEMNDDALSCSDQRRRELSMIDVPSGSTESTLDQYIEDDFDFMNMNELPPTIQIEPGHDVHGHDEVVYDVNDVNEVNVNVINNNDNNYDHTTTNRSDFGQVQNDNHSSINHINSNQHINHVNHIQMPSMNGNSYSYNNCNHINHININHTNNSNNNNNNNIHHHQYQNNDGMLSLQSATPNYTDFNPPFSNHINSMHLPVMNRSFTPNMSHNANVNHTFDVNQNETQRPFFNPPIPEIPELPETRLNGQCSSSSDCTLSSIQSMSYAPSRGMSTQLNVSRNRYSPISAPHTPHTPHTPLVHHNQCGMHNHNNNNRRIIDNYPVRPFSPICYVNNYRLHQNNNINANNQPQPQQPTICNNQNEQTMMNYDGTSQHNDNDQFVFPVSNLLSSPTPLLGGFL